MAAGKVVAEFVSQQDHEQGESKGHARKNRSRVKVGEAEGLKESVEGRGLVVGVGRGEVRSGNQGG